MACYHPLKAYPSFVSPDSGKQQYKICSYDSTCIWYNGQNLVPKFDDPSHWPGSISDFIEIPCGQCLGCRIQRSREWANRCLLELLDHPGAPGYFVTVTYDDEHIPRVWYGDPAHNGLAHQAFTLRRRDVTLLMKRIRKRFPDLNIRFFGCGEYGPQTWRPHYHLIIFGLVLDDLVPSQWRAELDGVQYFESATFDRLWKFQRRDRYGRPYGKRCNAGRCLIGEISWQSCAYTARYVTKKLTGDASELYERFNIDPPFSCMSLKPAIGRMYFDSHPELYNFEYINVSTPQGGKKFRPPRYFDKLYDVEYPEEMKSMKEFRRSAAEAQKELKLSMTDLSYLDYLSVEEESFRSRLNSLTRKNL